MTAMVGSDLARPNVRGSFGVCASTHWVASSVAQSVLERGGNAFDAATAAAFVLHVVEPHLNGPGGDLVALIAPAVGPLQVLNGQGPAPQGATPEVFLDLGLDSVPGSGAMSAAVPGAVDAWLLLLRTHGTWELEDIVAYAIDYAEHGHPLLPRAAQVIATVKSLFLEDWPTSAELWLRNGEAPDPNDVTVNPAYAATLHRMCVEARAFAGPGASRTDRIDKARWVWSTGFVAEAIERFVADSAHRHSTGGVHRGVLTASDMQNYAATFEAPVTGTRPEACTVAC